MVSSSSLIPKAIEGEREADMCDSALLQNVETTYDQLTIPDKLMFGLSDSSCSIFSTIETLGPIHLSQIPTSQNTSTLLSNSSKNVSKESETKSLLSSRLVYSATFLKWSKEERRRG